jgi:hypothetical protein
MLPLAVLGFLAGKAAFATGPLAPDPLRKSVRGFCIRPVTARRHLANTSARDPTATDSSA